MCGFVGYIKGTTQYADHSGLIHAMADTIRHRGPDSDGYFEDDDVVFGFRRLKIIDMSDEANQPLFNGDHTSVLMVNGEVYNFKELRQELMDMGYHFRSQTDAEVIIHGYDAWKTDVIRRLRGMFALAIWDQKERSLLLARDPFGIKPLYYGEASDDGTFFFGSEIKSFLPHPSFKKELNNDALLPYLTFQYSATPETFFRKVYKLEPGHWMRIQGGKIQTEKYWDFSFDSESNASIEEITASIRDVMHESVKTHEVSDVKVGAFLSGGIDSSYIAMLSQPEDTFTVGFASPDQQYDESDLAEDFSKMQGFHHHKKRISPDEFFASLPTIQYHMDEPQSNLSAVPLYFLAEMASHYVTVVLSGEGSDEIFGGYHPYVETPHLIKYKQMLPLGVRRMLYHLSKHLPVNRVTDLWKRGGETPEESFFGEAVIFEPGTAEQVLKEPYRHGISCQSLTDPIYAAVADADDLTKKQVLDLKLWMPGDILLKADKMSSAHSLELRVPFLDKKVMHVAEQVPAKYRVHQFISKYALRRAAMEELPKEWADRPKVGFPVPIRYWLREEKYVAPIRELFSSDLAAQRSSGGKEDESEKNLHHLYFPSVVSGIFREAHGL